MSGTNNAATSYTVQMNPADGQMYYVPVQSSVNPMNIWMNGISGTNQFANAIPVNQQKSTLSLSNPAATNYIQNPFITSQLSQIAQPVPAWQQQAFNAKMGRIAQNAVPSVPSVPSAPLPNGVK